MHELQRARASEVPWANEISMSFGDNHSDIPAVIFGPANDSKLQIQRKQVIYHISKQS